jgi:hypothetical protein
MKAIRKHALVLLMVIGGVVFSGCHLFYPPAPPGPPGLPGLPPPPPIPVP